jgi:DNA-binding IclR family transcriptional regulator
MSSTHERPGYPIESVDRALMLLLALEETDAISVSEAGEMLGVSRSTAYRLLSMLQYRDFVRQDPRTKAYVGGPALLRVGLAAVRQLDVRATVRPLLEAIVEELDETAHLVVLQRADAFFLDCVESHKAIRAAARTGTSLPAHCTAGGKVLLAQLAPERLRSLLSDTKLAALTPKSLTSVGALAKELERVRQQGYALNDGESEVGLRAVAVSLRSGRPSVDASIVVSAPEARMNAKRVAKVARTIRLHASKSGA